MFVNVIWIVVPALCVAVFWVFNRALRQVFARSRQCGHRTGPSLGYAAFYTFLYTGWLFAILVGVQYLKAR